MTNVDTFFDSSKSNFNEIRFFIKNWEKRKSRILSLLGANLVALVLLIQLSNEPIILPQATETSKCELVTIPNNNENGDVRLFTPKGDTLTPYGIGSQGLSASVGGKRVLLNKGEVLNDTRRFGFIGGEQTIKFQTPVDKSNAYFKIVYDNTNNTKTFTIGKECKSAEEIADAGMPGTDFMLSKDFAAYQGMTIAPFAPTIPIATKSR